MNPAFPAHLPMANISEGGSIKIPPACPVNIVNSLMSLLMEKISLAYICVKVSQLWRMMNYSANDKSLKKKNSGYSVGLIRPHTRAMMILLTSARVCVRMCACVRLTVCSLWSPAKGVFCLLVDEGNEGWVSSGSGAFGEDRRRTLQSKHPFQLLQDAVLARKCFAPSVISYPMVHMLVFPYSDTSHIAASYAFVSWTCLSPVMLRLFNAYWT